MNNGFKLRWRMLTRDELRRGDCRAVAVARLNEHYVEPCVLEFMADGQTVKDFWQPVEVVSAEHSQSDAGDVTPGTSL